MKNCDNPAQSLNNSIWLPNWRMQKSLDSAIQALQQNRVKTVSPFWYEINNVGFLTVKPGSDNLKIPNKPTLDLLKKHNASVIPTVTTTLMPDNFIQHFSDHSEQQRVAISVRNEVLRNGYDGIDLDLENIALTTDVPTAKKVCEIYTSLCRNISAELASVNKKLSITVMPRWSDEYEVWRGKLIPAVYDYKALSETAAIFRVMAYDQHAPNTLPGPIAGFEWVKNICAWTSRNVDDPGKVEIGIPLYGRDWGGNKVKSIVYNNVAELREMFPKSEVIYSETEREETFCYTDSAGNKHRVWYSNDRSVMDRLALIYSHGFRGGAFWAASFESPGLWEYISKASHPI